MYDTVEEARQKLEGTVVLYNNVPVYIFTATKDRKEILLHYLAIPVTGTAEKQTARIDDPSWDFKSIGSKLGYFSIRNPYDGILESAFLTRIPVRHSRQGLDNKTTQILSLDRENGYGYQWNDVTKRESSLPSTIKNIFPTAKQAFDLVYTDEQYRSIPFHRKLTLFYDKISPPYLIYRNTKIGYTENGEVFKLAKQKEYLKEELVDMVGLKIA